jgi:hypothetical protein
MVKRNQLRRERPHSSTPGGLQSSCRFYESCSGACIGHPKPGAAHIAPHHSYRYAPFRTDAASLDCDLAQDTDKFGIHIIQTIRRR